MAYYVGIDVGGTFTDICVADGDGAAVRGHWSTAPAFVAAARLAFAQLSGR